jgi:PPOX class probable F420-dependent enzyme
MEKLSAKSLALLKGKNFASIATINRDGSPQVTPVWIDTDGKNAIVNTAVGRTKERNIERDARVAISIFDMKDPYHRVSFDGKVVKKTLGKAAEEHIDFLAMKYTGKKYDDWKPGMRREILVIEPTRIREQ